MMTMIWYGLLCVGGGLVTAITGFGFALVVMMLLPYVWPDLRFCVAVAGCVSVAVSGVVWFLMRKHIRMKKMIWPLLGSFAATAMAMWLFSGGANALLTRIFGGVLVLFSVWFLLLSSRVKVPRGAAAGLVSGGLSGLLGALFSTSGPPIAAWMLITTPDRDEYMANIQMFFTLTSAHATVMRAVNGQITGPVLLYAAAGLAIGMAGYWAGKKIAGKMNAKAIRLCVCILMAVSGVNLLVN